MYHLSLSIQFVFDNELALGEYSVLIKYLFPYITYTRKLIINDEKLYTLYSLCYI